MKDGRWPDDCDRSLSLMRIPESCIPMQRNENESMAAFAGLPRALEGIRAQRDNHLTRAAKGLDNDR